MIFKKHKEKKRLKNLFKKEVVYVDTVMTIKFEIEKTDFGSISPIDRDKFLKLTYWYYLLRLQEAANKNDVEILMRANEMLTFYNSIKTLHDMEQNHVTKLLEKAAEEVEWPAPEIITKPEKDLTKDELKQKIAMEWKKSIL